MFAGLRSWLFQSRSEREIVSALSRWFDLQHRQFAGFNGDPIAAVGAELAAARSSSESLPILICADGSGIVRALAIIKAGLERRLDCEDALIAALLDESDTVRRTAARALLDLDTVRGLAAVVAGNRHGHGVRTLAAFRLKELGANATPAIPALFRLINYDDINWRSHGAAASALAAIGPNALPYLIHALRYGSRAGRSWAAIALNERGDCADLPEDVVQILKNSQTDQ